MSNTIYVMGVKPGETTGVTILGVPYLSMYGTSPYRRNYFELFEVSGGYTSQALEICDASREFFPIAMVVESFFPARSDTAKTEAEEYLSPVLVGARIEFCIETKYILTNIFWQTQSQAIKDAPDSRLKACDLYKPGPDHVQDSTRHVVTFLRRAKDDTAIRDRAWGSPQTRSRPTKRVLKRSARTV